MLGIDVARYWVQGYVEAAQTFEKESGTQPGVDLGAITDRMEIRKAVQSGNVEEAIERVNDLNPEVNLVSLVLRVLSVTLWPWEKCNGTIICQIYSLHP